MKKRTILLKMAAYTVSALLLIFYLLMLLRCADPKVSDDYRMRYLENGYFWEEQG